MIFVRSEVNFLKEKLENLEKKIIVGGENLLEKAEEQEKLLEASAQELEQRMTREEQLQRELEVKEVSSTLDHRGKGRKAGLKQSCKNSCIRSTSSYCIKSAYKSHAPPRPLNF